MVATNDDEVSIHNCTTQISITERRSQINSGNIAPESCISHSTNDHSTEEVSEVQTGGSLKETEIPVIDNPRPVKRGVGTEIDGCHGKPPALSTRSRRRA